MFQFDRFLQSFMLVSCGIFVFLVNPLFSQNYIHFSIYDVDSLELVLKEQHSEERINTLNHLAKSLSFRNYRSSIQYAEEAMNLSTKVDYGEGKATAFENYGHIYQYQGDYAKALNNYLESLKIFDRLGMIKRSARLCYDISKTHYFARNYEKTVEYAKLALKKYRMTNDKGKKIGNVRDTMNIICGLALTYYYMGKCDQSVEYTVDYIIVGEQNNFQKTDLFLHEILIGERYFCDGQTVKAKKQLLNLLTGSHKDLGVETLKYRARSYLGYIYLKEGMIDSAIYYFENARSYYEKTGILFWQLNASNNLGNIYFKLNRQAKANDYFLESEKIFQEILERDSWFRYDSLKNTVTWGLELYFPLPPLIMKDLAWQQGKFLYQMLYLISKNMNQIENALKFHEAYSVASDTLNKWHSTREMMELQTKFETEKNEEEIANLSQKTENQELKIRQSRIYLFGLGIIIIFIALLSFILIRQNKLHEKQERLLLQQKLFRSQMNPHFIFNSLSSIQNFILDKEAIKANKYLSSFSKLIRNILDSTTEDYITLSEEINTITNYLELQKIRYQDKFEYTVHVDHKIDPENMVIPPMLAQPFIENSIEHGIKHKKVKGHIQIRFSLKNDVIIFEVEDDGIGREKAKEIAFHQNKDHRSLATKITHDRIQLLNKKLKRKIMFAITDLKDELKIASGTKVIIEIPVL